MGIIKIFADGKLFGYAVYNDAFSSALVPAIIYISMADGP
jgi:hypothetical protein